MQYMERIGADMNELNAHAIQARFDFLIIDAETALTMLDLAEATNSPETRDRRRKVAEDAYRTMLSFVSKTRFTDAQLAALNQRLSWIRTRLFMSKPGKK
jgi:hypothetical protein